MNGFALTVTPDSEQGYSSDYNTLYTTGAGQVAQWEGDPFPRYIDWFYSVGQDEHSIALDPRFIDPDGLCHKVAFLRPNLKVECQEINDLRD